MNILISIKSDLLTPILILRVYLYRSILFAGKKNFPRNQDFKPARLPEINLRKFFLCGEKYKSI